MADTVKFELVSPERLLFSADVESVVVPGTEGDFGVLPGHARLISTVRPGVISVFQNGKVTDRIFVEGGFAEVTATGCTVLAEHALPVSDIQRDQAQHRCHRRQHQCDPHHRLRREPDPTNQWCKAASIDIGSCTSFGLSHPLNGRLSFRFLSACGLR